MANGKRTTSKARRASVANATKAPPVQWGADEKGCQVVIHASGRWARDLPLVRLRGLRDTIDDMGQVVKAFDGTRDIAADGQRLTMLSMTASVARALMVQAADDMRAVLALDPQSFDVLVRQGHMPQATRIGNTEVWDRHKLDAAFSLL
jgi:hypothetical protein